MKKLIIPSILLFGMFATIPTYAMTALTITKVPIVSSTTTAEQARLTNIKAKADNYITLRIDSLQSLLNYMQIFSKAKDSTFVLASTTQGQAVTTSVNADIAGLTTLKTQIDAFSDPTQIKTGLLPLVESIFSTYRVYAIEIPKDRLLLHSAITADLATHYTKLSTTMTSDIALAHAKGKDTTLLTADLQAFSLAVGKFSGDLTLAQTAISAITPANYQKGVNTFTSVKAIYATVNTDTKTIHASVAKFITDYKQLIK